MTLDHDATVCNIECVCSTFTRALGRRLLVRLVRFSLATLRLRGRRQRTRMVCSTKRLLRKGTPRCRRNLNLPHEQHATTFGPSRTTEALQPQNLNLHPVLHPSISGRRRILGFAIASNDAGMWP